MTLLLHMGALGDFALVWPALRTLRRRQPATRVVAALSEGRRAFATAVGCDGEPLADETLSIDSPLFTPLFGDDRSRDGELRRALRDHATVVSFLGSPDSHFHQRLREVTAGTLITVDPRPQPGLREHIVDQWSRQAPGLFDGLDEPFEPYEPSRRNQSVNEPRTSVSGRVFDRPDESETTPGTAVIHPGSGGRDKCWPTDRFVAVADALAAAGLEPVIIVGEVELERGLPLPDRFAARSPSPVELVRLLAGAAVFIGNDSGPAHVAAALGTPVAAIFRSTDPSVWRPRGRRVRVVGEGLPSPAPRAPGSCPWGATPTIVDPAVDDVLAAVAELTTTYTPG